MSASNNEVFPFANLSCAEARRRIQWNIYYGYYYQVYHPLTILYCASGLLTNTINVVVLTRPAMRNPWNFLMTALMISDMIFLIARGSSSVVYFMYPTPLDYVTVYTTIYLNGVYTMEYSSMMSSEWLNATIGAWRLVAVKWPQRARNWCTTQRAKITAVAIGISSFLVNLASVFLKEKETFYYNGTNVTFLVRRDFEISSTEVILYIVLLEVLVALPIVCAIGTTACLVQNIYLFYENRQILRPTEDAATAKCMNSTTIMLTVVLGLFLLSNAPTAILYIVYYAPTITVIQNYRNIFLILQGLDKTTTLFVYIALSTEYRHTVRTMFCSPKTKPSDTSTLNLCDHNAEAHVH